MWLWCLRLPCAPIDLFPKLTVSNFSLSLVPRLILLCRNIFVWLRILYIPFLHFAIIILWNLFLQNVVLLRDYPLNVTCNNSFFNFHPNFLCTYLTNFFHKFLFSSLCVQLFNILFFCLSNIHLLSVIANVLAVHFKYMKILMGANPCSGMTIGFENLCFLVYIFLWFPCHMQCNNYLFALELAVVIWDVFLCCTIWKKICLFLFSYIFANWGAVGPFWCQPG